MPLMHPRKGDTFTVPSGNLGFSVLVYTVLAVFGIALLMFRRGSASCGNSELGGPVASKRFSAAFLILLWITYITMSSMQAYGVIGGF